jgi:transcriptional regulator with XRE-family HTH domain
MTSKLKLFRKDILGLTQEEFAVRICAVQHQISDWERGYSTPNLLSIKRINAAFAEDLQNARLSVFNKFDFGVIEELELS